VTVNGLLVGWTLANAGITIALLRGFRPGRRFSLGTTVLDVLFGAALVYVTNGFDSPYFLAFFLAIVASSVRFGMAASVMSALAIVVIYLVVGGTAPLISYYHSPVAGLQALGKVIMFPCVALISGTMARELVRERRIAIGRAAKAEALQEMNAAMATCLDIDEFFQVLLVQSARITESEQARLIMVGERGTFTAAAHGEGVEGLPDVAIDALRRAVAAKGPRIEGSKVLLAIGSGDEGTPVLVLESPHGVTGDRLMLLNALAGSAALTMGNALRYQRRSLEAITDPLTGLLNRREFRRRLELELSRSRRQGGQVSLMLIDVDRFKRVNDTMGHRHGDEVLRKVAGVARSTVRSHDVVARYGGDELAVVLLDAGAAACRSLAERLIENAREAQISLHGGGHLTLSVGVAGYPEDALSVDELVMAADQALYLAKREGRDNVQSSGTLVDRFRRDPHLLLQSVADAGPQVVVAVARAADLAQDEGHGHSSRVSALAAALADRAGCSASDVEVARLAALLHEAGHLVSVERAGNNLAVRAEWLLSQGSFDPRVRHAVRHQRERWDGTGEPDRLRGADIPVTSRAISLACGFDKLTAGAEGERALAPNDAVARLREQARRQYDPRLVETLADLTLASGAPLEAALSA
jgi:diguanylate cyclase (GGDEF)-like protein